MKRDMRKGRVHEVEEINESHVRVRYIVGGIEELCLDFKCEDAKNHAWSYVNAFWENNPELNLKTHCLI